MYLIDGAADCESNSRGERVFHGEGMLGALSHWSHQVDPVQRAALYCLKAYLYPLVFSRTLIDERDLQHNGA